MATKKSWIPSKPSRPIAADAEQSTSAGRSTRVQLKDVGTYDVDRSSTVIDRQRVRGTQCRRVVGRRKSGRPGPRGLRAGHRRSARANQHRSRAPRQPLRARSPCSTRSAPVRAGLPDLGLRLLGPASALDRCSELVGRQWLRGQSFSLVISSLQRFATSWCLFHIPGASFTPSPDTGKVHVQWPWGAEGHRLPS